MIFSYRRKRLFFNLLIFLGGCSALAADKKDAAPRFRADVDLVVVHVSVTDPLNRYVVGLEKEQFRIFENKVEQSILHFSSSKSPVSVGIILDVSGSMSDNLLSAQKSVVKFLDQGDLSDEYFLVAFNQQATLLKDFTSRRENIQNQISISAAKGRTALFDAVYLGLEKIREAGNSKKALIVITDGEDNSSRYTFTEVRDFARESDAQIYVIGERGELGYGHILIEEIVRLSGGRAFFPTNFKQLDYFVDLIHTELRNQYLLGYRPTNRHYDGKWRKIKVNLNPPEGLPRLSVRAKEGYLAPQRLIMGDHHYSYVKY